MKNTKKKNTIPSDEWKPNWNINFCYINKEQQTEVFKQLKEIFNIK